MGPSSLSKDRTGVPCAGSMESKPLDHQGSPMILLVSNGGKGKQKLWPGRWEVLIQKVASRGSCPGALQKWMHQINAYERRQEIERAWGVQAFLAGLLFQREAARQGKGRVWPWRAALGRVATGRLEDVGWGMVDRGWKGSADQRAESCEVRKWPLSTALRTYCVSPFVEDSVRLEIL